MGIVKDWNPEVPWGAQPCDVDSSAYHWFGIYLYVLTPPRHDWLRLLRAKGCRATSDVMHEWFRKGHWEARAGAFDRHVVDQMRRAREAEIETLAQGMQRRHQAAKLWTTISAREAERLLEEQAKRETSGVIRPELALRAMATGIEAEHRALGVAVPEVAQASADYSKLSDEELRALQELQAKALAS